MKIIPQWNKLCHKVEDLELKMSLKNLIQPPHFIGKKREAQKVEWFA